MVYDTNHEKKYDFDEEYEDESDVYDDKHQTMKTPIKKKTFDHFAEEGKLKMKDYGQFWKSMMIHLKYISPIGFYFVKLKIIIG